MKTLFSVLALLASVLVVESAVAATPATLETAPTKFVDAGGTHFAYRTIGTKTGVPLVLLQHFTGTIDYWDPAVVNGLAMEREVIVFDNTGVGASSGKVPDSVEQMSTDALAFIKVLNLQRVDLLGYSLGGMIAQNLAAQRPDLVRKVILANTAHQGGGKIGPQHDDRIDQQHGKGGELEPAGREGAQPVAKLLAKRHRRPPACAMSGALPHMSEV